MTIETKQNRRLHLDLMTRIEGEGGISLEMEDGHLKDVTVDIFEPPRLFEGFLRGRAVEEVPDLVARICGICPVAYQLTSVQALEGALGVEVSPEIRTLRQLLYLGEWIQSHVLHIFFLQLPDLFGKPDALSLGEERTSVVRDGLRMKQIGNRIMEVIGGRSVHPVNVCVGGFYRAPKKADIHSLREDVKWALGKSEQTLNLLSGLKLPELTRQIEFVALSRPDEYAVLDGRLQLGSSCEVPFESFEQTFIESQVAHSTALHSQVATTGESYMVGPLARIHINHEKLSPKAHAASLKIGLSGKTSNPYAGILARAVETIHCCDAALSIIEQYVEPSPSRVPIDLKEGEGFAVTEAPRGALYHHYRIDKRGLVEFARIVPPTSQNLKRMEDDLRLLVDTVTERTDNEILGECEKLVRCYDPCVSCSVHAVRRKS